MLAWIRPFRSDDRRNRKSGSGLSVADFGLSWRASRLAAVALVFCSYASAQTSSPFVPGSIQGQDGWTGGTIAIVPQVDQAVVQVGSNAHAGMGSWRASNSTVNGNHNGAFAGWPFSPGLAVSAGQPSSGAGADQFSATLFFKSGSSVADGSNMELDLGTTSGDDRNTFLAITNDTDGDGGLKLRASEPDGVTGGFLPTQILATGLSRTAWHRIDILAKFYDGDGNDTWEVSLNGVVLNNPLGGTTFGTFEGFRNGIAAPYALSNRLFWRSGGAASGFDPSFVDNAAQGFYFDDVSYRASTQSNPTVSLASYAAAFEAAGTLTSPVYVDDSWVGMPFGTDPDDGGPATSIGFDAFVTIQGGVNGVTTGGTVNVNAGSYNGPQVLIARSMSVLGAGAATTILDGLGAAPPTAGLVHIETLLGDTGSVTFSGFTVTNPGTGGGAKFAIVAKPLDPSTTVTISNNEILGVAADDGGIWVYRNRGPVVFDHNGITNAGGNGVLIEQPLNSTDVHTNTISVTGASSSYFSMTYGSEEITTLQRVADNTIDGPLATAITFNSAPTFVSPADRFGKFTNVQITNNVITQLGADRSGIALLNDTTDATGILGGIENPSITGNRITGTDAATSNGIRFRGLVTNAAITSNDLRDTSRGFFGELATAGHSATGTEAHLNSIVSNAGGLVWDGLSALDAENNWWGCNAGPGNAGCDAVTGGADFDPWIVLGVSASPSSIPPFTTSTVTADMTDNSAAADTSGAGTVPLTPVTFSATAGTMAPPTGTITAGLASSTFTSTSTSSGTGCAMVDNQLTCANILVVDPPTATPTATGTVTATVPASATPTQTETPIATATPTIPQVPILPPAGPAGGVLILVLLGVSLLGLFTRPARKARDSRQA